ncbi:unnamed protein product [Amoebophrya sp. A25]|nr:unnamed protein product [Amoebophrya sp. A25]|eukprot:GSA25T00013145001.1
MVLPPSARIVSCTEMRTEAQENTTPRARKATTHCWSPSAQQRSPSPSPTSSTLQARICTSSGKEQSSSLRRLVQIPRRGENPAATDSLNETVDQLLHRTQQLLNVDHGDDVEFHRSGHQVTSGPVVSSSSDAALPSFPSFTAMPSVVQRIVDQHASAASEEDETARNMSLRVQELESKLQTLESLVQNAIRSEQPQSLSDSQTVRKEQVSLIHTAVDPGHQVERSQGRSAATNALLSARFSVWKPAVQTTTTSGATTATSSAFTARPITSSRLFPVASSRSDMPHAPAATASVIPKNHKGTSHSHMATSNDGRNSSTNLSKKNVTVHLVPTAMKQMEKAVAKSPKEKVAPAKLEATPRVIHTTRMTLAGPRVGKIGAPLPAQAAQAVSMTPSSQGIMINVDTNASSKSQVVASQQRSRSQDYRQTLFSTAMNSTSSSSARINSYYSTTPPPRVPRTTNFGSQHGRRSGSPGLRNASRSPGTRRSGSPKQVVAFASTSSSTVRNRNKNSNANDLLLFTSSSSSQEQKSAVSLSTGRSKTSRTYAFPESPGARQYTQAASPKRDFPTLLPEEQETEAEGNGRIAIHQSETTKEENNDLHAQVGLGSQVTTRSATYSTSLPTTGGNSAVPPKNRFTRVAASETAAPGQKGGNDNHVLVVNSCGPSPTEQMVRASFSRALETSSNASAPLIPILPTAESLTPGVALRAPSPMSPNASASLTPSPKYSQLGSSSSTMNAANKLIGSGCGPANATTLQSKSPGCARDIHYVASMNKAGVSPASRNPNPASPGLDLEQVLGANAEMMNERNNKASSSYTSTAQYRSTASASFSNGATPAPDNHDRKKISRDSGMPNAQLSGSAYVLDGRATRGCDQYYLPRSRVERSLRAREEISKHRAETRMAVDNAYETKTTPNKRTSTTPNKATHKAGDASHIAARRTQSRTPPPTGRGRAMQQDSTRLNTIKTSQKLQLQGQDTRAAPLPPQHYSPSSSAQQMKQKRQPVAKKGPRQRLATLLEDAEEDAPSMATTPAKIGGKAVAGFKNIPMVNMEELDCKTRRQHVVLGLRSPEDEEKQHGLLQRSSKEKGVVGGQERDNSKGGRTTRTGFTPGQQEKVQRRYHQIDQRAQVFVENPPPSEKTSVEKRPALVKRAIEASSRPASSRPCSPQELFDRNVILVRETVSRDGSPLMRSRESNIVAEEVPLQLDLDEITHGSYSTAKANRTSLGPGRSKPRYDFSPHLRAVGRKRQVDRDANLQNINHSRSIPGDITTANDSSTGTVNGACAAIQWSPRTTVRQRYPGDVVAEARSDVQAKRTTPNQHSTAASTTAEVQRVVESNIAVIHMLPEKEGGLRSSDATAAATPSGEMTREGSRTPSPTRRAIRTSASRFAVQGPPSATPKKGQRFIRISEASAPSP